MSPRGKLSVPGHVNKLQTCKNCKPTITTCSWSIGDTMGLNVCNDTPCYRALHSNAFMMSTEEPDFDGTAAHGPAALSVEQECRRIMLSTGNQQRKFENPLGDINVHFSSCGYHIGFSWQGSVSPGGWDVELCPRQPPGHTIDRGFKNGSCPGLIARAPGPPRG